MLILGFILWPKAVNFLLMQPFHKENVEWIFNSRCHFQFPLCSVGMARPINYQVVKADNENRLTVLILMLPTAAQLLPTLWSWN